MHHVVLFLPDGTKFADAAFDANQVSAHVAASPEQGLELLRELRGAPLIVTDARPTPKWDAFEIVLKAKEASPTARVVIVSSDDAVDTGLDGTDAPVGALRYLKKPLDAERLRAMGEALLGGPGADRHALDNLELIDIVQLACIARRSAVLHLRHEDVKGRIAFDKGVLVHAEFGDKSGREALLDLLALRQGNMFLQGGATADKRTISERWTELMRAAAGTMSERRARLDREAAARRGDDAITESDVNDLLRVNEAPGSASTSGEIAGGGALFNDADLAEIGDMAQEPAAPRSAPASEPLARAPEAPLHESGAFRPPQNVNRPPSSTSQTARTLQQLVQDFCDEIPEFIATDIIHTTDGLSIIGASAIAEYDSQAASAYYSDVLRSCLRAAEDFTAHADLEDVQLITQNAYILIRALQGTPYMHLLLMHKTGNLGIGRVTMRRFEPLFARVLTAPPTR